MGYILAGKMFNPVPQFLPQRPNINVEIQVALNFVISYLYHKLPRRRVNLFAEEFEKALKEKFRGHWYPDKPYKGSAYRCIRIDPSDSVLKRAAKESGLSMDDILEQLPLDVAIWVDPGEVSYRVGERGPVTVLFSEFDQFYHGYTLEREILKTYNPEAACFRPAESHCTYYELFHQPLPNNSPITPGFPLLPTFHSNSNSMNNHRRFSASTTASASSTQNWISFNGSRSPSSTFVPRTTAPLTFTTATFAQTKFGSTKLKNSNKRANRMSPNEFSNYIKQQELQQQQMQQQRMQQQQQQQQQQMQQQMQYQMQQRMERQMQQRMVRQMQQRMVRQVQQRMERQMQQQQIQHQMNQQYAIQNSMRGRGLSPHGQNYQGPLDNYHFHNGQSQVQQQFPQQNYYDNTQYVPDVYNNNFSGNYYPQYVPPQQNGYMNPNVQQDIYQQSGDNENNLGDGAQSAPMDYEDFSNGN